MKRFPVILFLSAVILLQGCGAFIASQFGYHEAQGKYTRLYNDYKSAQEKTNLEREKTGLALEPVKEYGVWLKEQPLTSNEIKVFKYYGSFSPQEAKEIKTREAARARAIKDALRE